MQLSKTTFMLAVSFLLLGNCYATDTTSYIAPRYNVSLGDAHKGTEEIDMKLLESYLSPPSNVRNFYVKARAHFVADSLACFTDTAIIQAAAKNEMPLMGGPSLGSLTTKSVTVWLRPATDDKLKIKVKRIYDKENRPKWLKRLFERKRKSYRIKHVKAGKEQREILHGLKSNAVYYYEVLAKRKKIAGGLFTTAPNADENSIFRVTFGSCFHKIGLHNPNLINQILQRQPQAMMLLGDIAADGRKNNSNLLRSDYMLRDLSLPWQKLAANVPLYATWDDHDYHSNDRGGVYDKFTVSDREVVREVWSENWNNPDNEAAGIYFNTRIGPVEIIMLDTRSCRENERRGEYGAYLGEDQQKWLLKTLKASTAPFKIISSGTMWSDYITPGKDSWGTWDTTGREEVFKLIEDEKIKGVMLISGDRHGARGFTIPRPSGYKFHEFETATLGGVPGPPAMAKDSSMQLFGYQGEALFAFGEFTFDTMDDEPTVTFRLINQSGEILEEHLLSYEQLIP